MSRTLRHLSSVLALAGFAVGGTAGCVLVPVPGPVVGPPVVVAPRPPVVVVPGPVYRSGYHPYHHHHHYHPGRWR